MKIQEQFLKISLIITSTLIIIGAVYYFTKDNNQEMHSENSLELQNENIDNARRDEEINDNSDNNNPNSIDDGDHYVIITEVFKENDEILISFDLVQRIGGQIINENPLIRTLKTSTNFEATKEFWPFDDEQTYQIDIYNSEQILLESKNTNSFIGSYIKYNRPVFIRIENGYVTNLNPGYWPG